MKKQLAIIMLLTGTTAAQVPQPKKAIVEADVLLVGCAPKFHCGIMAAAQPVAIKITKVASGPLKVGDTPVLDILACTPGPLLVADHNDGFVELDPKQIRRGSKIKVELDVYPTGSSATTDKITVTKL